MPKDLNINKNKFSKRDLLAYKRLQLHLKEGHLEYLPILNFIEKYYTFEPNQSFELDDFIQECSLRIYQNNLEQIRMNPATVCHRVYQKLRNQDKDLKKLEDTLSYPASTTTYEMSTNFELPQLFKKISQDLTPRYQQILTYYYGFNNLGPFTQTEIANIFHVSRARIQKVLSNCYKIFHDNMLLYDYDEDGSLQNKAFPLKPYQQYILKMYQKKEKDLLKLEKNTGILLHFFRIKRNFKLLESLSLESLSNIMEIYELCAWDLPKDFSTNEALTIRADYETLWNLFTQSQNLTLQKKEN